MAPSGHKDSICPYCGVGCRVELTLGDDGAASISARSQDRPNYGKLCPKGGHLGKVLTEEGRLLHPQLRLDREQPFARVPWPVATAYAASRLREILERHGPDAVAFYGSGQLDTEACYLSGKLFKGYLGTNHTDSNSRLCMSSAVAAYQAAFGSDGPPTCYDDIEHADTFLIVGANMADCHPVLFQRLRQRRRENANVRLIVIDPRRTKTAEQAHLHLQLKPGSDLPLLQAIAKAVLEGGWWDHRFVEHHTGGFEAWRAELQALDLKTLAAECGVPLNRILDVAETIRRSRRLLSFYAMGANQSSRGVANNQAILNLHLLTGQIGMPGAGPFSLTGQPNAMGGRETGYLSHQLPGYRKVAVEADRRQVEALWGLPPGSISPTPGLAAVELFEAVGSGRIKAIWIAATNPAASMPQVETVRAALRRAELVIVQDIYHPTSTSQFADLLLPAAQWAEKTGTSTNSERLVTRSSQLVPAPGEVRPDWWILAAVARELGFPNFEYDSAESVWNEIRLATRRTNCDQWGITNRRLRRGPLQWPCPSGLSRGTARRYTTHRFPSADGRAQFGTGSGRPPADQPTPDYPLLLTTGRIASQWHTMTRTGRVTELVRQEPEPFCQMHPEDAARAGLVADEWVWIESVRGRFRARARLTDAVLPGTLFSPFHWTDIQGEHLLTNAATSPAADPISHQPELKYAAVRLRPVGDDVGEAEAALAEPMAR